MQTRVLAAAGGALLALGLSLFDWRPAFAGSAAPPARDVCCAEEILPDDCRLDGNGATNAGPVAALPTTTLASTLGAERRAELALAIPDPALRTRTLAGILSAWAATDAGAALIWLERHFVADKPLLVQSIGEGLAADPAGATFALTYLAQDREHGALLAGALVRALANDGRAASAVRLARVEPEGWRHEWATVAFTNLAYADAVAALEAVATVDDPPLRRTIAAAIIAGWAEQDPEELARHADAFTAPEERARALSVAVAEWAQRDPAGARSFVATIGPWGSP